jgi:hypothetical protein
MASKGLAWFSRQIPTEGFSDVSEGRFGETEIPHSDQWLPTIGHNDSYRPDRFNRTNVLRGKNGRGVSEVIVEEIYQSGEYRLESGVGLHNASYLNGRFIYESPANWVNANTVNRTIALRRCDVKPRAYNFTINFKIDNSAVVAATISITSDVTIQDALSSIASKMKKATGGLTEFEWAYDDHRVILGSKMGQSSITFTAVEDAFWEMMNVEPARRNDYVNVAAPIHLFPNVWDRSSLYIHASFVNNTAGGFLSRGDEFYSSPSKQYKVEYPISTFFFETSFDGYHKIALPYENFIVELSFLIDVENYY